MEIDYSSDSTSIEAYEDKKNTNSRFVNLLIHHQILFNKSQVPHIKASKEKALANLRINYEQTFGKEITEKQLQKKIQNLKNSVKKKTCKTATGNKKNILKDWEESVLNMMKWKGKNAVFIKVEDCPIVGEEFTEAVAEPKKEKTVQQEQETATITLPQETEETQHLSINELQRLLLLEQLKLTRIQIKKEELKYKKIKFG